MADCKRNAGKIDLNKRLASMCRAYAEIIDELYNPIDSINRFINLALQNIGDDSQGRQFLLESKNGIRKTSLLLRRLNTHNKRMEKHIRDTRTEKNE